MGMLDRYKKKGGFNQLLNLIETSSKTKQEHFLKLVADENPSWMKALKEKKLTLEKILSWDDSVKVEIISRSQLLTIATLFHGLTVEQVESKLSFLSSLDRRKIILKISELNPTQSEKITCEYKLIAETRMLINQNVIKLDKVGPELVVPENIEELLDNEDKGTEQSNSISGKEMNEAGLLFPKMEEASPVTTLKSLDYNTNQLAENLKIEIDQLKRKNLNLQNENHQLKVENHALKTKLEQIKKIA